VRTAEGLASWAEDDALVRAAPVALGQARRVVGPVVVTGQLLIPPVLARGDDMVVGRQRARWLRRYRGRGGAQGDKGGNQTCSEVAGHWWRRADRRRRLKHLQLVCVYLLRAVVRNQVREDANL
jgi:hypothetical protein